jgi:hypothetical protein
MINQGKSLLFKNFMKHFNWFMGEKKIIFNFYESYFALTGFSFSFKINFVLKAFC